MMAKTRRLTLGDLKRSAAAIGATVEEDYEGRRADVQVVAPDGMVWACSGDIHALVLAWWLDERARPQWPQEKADAIADALERMGDGLAPCGDPECDWCHPEAE